MTLLVQLFINIPQELESATEHNTNVQQGNDLPHLISEKKYSLEKRSISKFRYKRDILLGSHQAFRDDNRSGYDEGEHKCHNERHYTSISCYKYDEGEHEFHKERHYTLISCYKDEGIQILCNTHPTRRSTGLWTKSSKQQKRLVSTLILKQRTETFLVFGV